MNSNSFSQLYLYIPLMFHNCIQIFHCGSTTYPINLLHIHKPDASTYQHYRCRKGLTRLTSVQKTFWVAVATGSGVPCLSALGTFPTPLRVIIPPAWSPFLHVRYRYQPRTSQAPTSSKSACEYLTIAFQIDLPTTTSNGEHVLI